MKAFTIYKNSRTCQYSFVGISFSTLDDKSFRREGFWAWIMDTHTFASFFRVFTSIIIPLKELLKAFFCPCAVTFYWQPQNWLRSWTSWGADTKPQKPFHSADVHAGRILRNAGTQARMSSSRDKVFLACSIERKIEERWRSLKIQTISIKFYGTAIKTPSTPTFISLSSPFACIEFWAAGTTCRYSWSACSWRFQLNNVSTYVFH